MALPSHRRRPSWWTLTGVVVVLVAAAACSVEPGARAGSTGPGPDAGPTTPTPTAGRPSDSASPTPSTPSPPTPTAPTPTTATGPVRSVRITVGGRSIVADLADTPTGQALADQLPLTLTFSDFQSQEKHAELPAPLTTRGAPAGSDPTIGDIGYYAPGNTLVFYYRDIGYYDGIVRIGRLADGDVALLRERAGEFDVRIDLA